MSAIIKNRNIKNSTSCDKNNDKKNNKKIGRIENIIALFFDNFFLIISFPK